MRTVKRKAYWRLPTTAPGTPMLARMGLSLDVGVCFPQLPELATFAKALPDLTIILNHLGGLTRVGSYANKDDEVIPAWRRGIAAVAECPNVHLKLGGMGVPRLGFDWHTRARPIGSEELASSMAPIRVPASNSSARTGACSRATSRSIRSRFPPRPAQCFQTVLEELFEPRARPPCFTTRLLAPMGSANPDSHGGT